MIDVQPLSFQIGGPSLWYVIYRVVAATYFSVMLVHNILTFDSYFIWFAYMAHWCFLVITTSAVLQAICVTRHYMRVKSLGFDSGEHPAPIRSMAEILAVLN